MNNAQSTTLASRRLLIWGILIVVLMAAVVGFVITLPRIAPQFVIAHSPWIWPVLQAEAYKTEGKEPDLSDQKEWVERLNLVDRLMNEENWEQAAIPVLTRALDHPDLRMRRTAASALSTLLTHNNGRTPVIQNGELVTRLRRLLDDPDADVFTHAFRLLLHHEDSASAQAILDYLPRACGVVPNGRKIPLDGTIYIFFGTVGEPHPLRHLRLADVVDQAQRWLATSDPDLTRLALMALGFSDDPQALPLLDAHLGKHLEQEEYWVGWDPAGYALSLNTQPGVIELLISALADADPVRRRSAAGALIGRDEIGQIDESISLARASIDDSDGEVRKQVAMALASFPLKQTLPDLCHLITRGGEPAVAAINRVRSNRMFLHRNRPWWGRGDIGPAVNADTPRKLGA